MPDNEKYIKRLKQSLNTSTSKNNPTTATGRTATSKSNANNNVSDQRVERLKESLRKSANNSTPSTNVDSAYIDRFVNDVNNFYTSSSNAYNKMGWDNAGTLSQNIKNTAGDLNTRSNEIRKWLSQTKNTLSADEYQNIKNMLDAYDSGSNDITKTFDDAAKMYAQFDSQEAYDSNVAYWKDYNEKSAYDVAAGQKEIEALEEQLKQLRNSKATAVNPVNGMPYAVGQQAVYTEEYAPAANNANGMPYAAYQQAVYAPVDNRETELTNEILRKKQYLNQAKQIQLKAAFESAAGNKDFAKQNAYVKNSDNLYNWINDEQFRDEYEAAQNEIYANATGTPNFGTRQSKYAKNSYGYMTDDEVKLYNYYYATQGAEKAQEYLDVIQEDLNRRAGEALAGIVPDETAAKIAFGAGVGLDQFKSGMKGTISSLTGKEDYIPQSKMQFAGQFVREDLADNGAKLPSWLGGGSLAQGAYDLVTTTANMAPSILASAAVSILNPAAGGYVGSALMGTSAAGNAYQTALNAGYDKNAARSYGVAIGVAETAMQSLLGGISSLGGVSPAVTKAVEGINNGLLRFFARWGASMASEGLEEGLQEVLDPILQNAILGADENVDWANVVYSALLGAASAGVLEVGGNLRQSAQEARAKREYGRNTDELIAEGLSYDAGTEANEIAQQYKARVDSGKSMTGAQIKHQLEANEVQRVETAARDRLVELGETDDPAEIAKLATKRAMGEVLKPAEKSRLARSKFGAQVAKELVPGTVAKGKLVDAMTRPGKYKPLDTRVETDVSERVSESGKNELADSGTEFDLKQIDAKTGNDGKLVWTVDGQEATSDNIKFKDEDTAYIFQAVEQIENITPTAAPVLVRSVDTSKDITKQLNGLDEAYTYGFYNYSVEDLKAGEFGANLTESQMMDAYRLGEAARARVTENVDASKVNLRTAEQKAAQVKKRMITDDTEVYFADGSEAVKFDQHKHKYDDKRMAGVNAAKFLSKMGIGGKFYFYESYMKNGVRVYKDASGKEVPAPNGIFKAADGSIYIDMNAGNKGEGTTLFTMGHELTHFVKAYSEKQFKRLADLVKEAYDNTELSLHQRVINKQETLSKIRNEHVSYDEAYEEVVADAMSTMMTDGSLYEKLAELRSTDKGLFNTIKRFFDEMIAKFKKVYESLAPDQQDAQDIREMKDMFDRIQNAFAEALVEASDNFQASLSETESEAVESLGENAKVETNADGEMLIASNKNRSVLVYSERTYLNGGRDKLETALRQNGHTEAEITETLSYVDDALDYIRVLAAGYAKQMGYTNLSNHLVADVITNVKTGKQVMSSIVNNGDYPVNIDLSLICKKRVAYMNLMSRLIRDGVFDKVNYDGAAIAEVNGILRENGFETACLGCFVESRRLQFQAWAETIVSEWNAEVEKRNPNADNFGFAKGDMQSLTDADINALTRELESVKKNDQGNVNLGQGNSVTRMGRLLDAIPSLQKKLTVEDLLTPEGLTALRQHDGSLFSIVKSRYGAASPKIVQDFNPYASEIAMLSFAQVKNITSNAVKGAQTYVKEVKNEYGKIVRANGESKENFNKRKKLHEQRIQDEAMRRYLYDIGGARIQSFSDFMIENVFDYIQIFADLAAKRLPLHGYTKEIVCMRLFGMTGAKWNGSLIAHVERSMGKELAGLLPAGTKDGIPVKVDGKDYVIGFDDYARNAATKGKSFIQSIGMKDILALQLDPRYSPYVGNITIGVSDAQITAMLDSPLFRMVIPYHASGMLPMFAKLVGVDMYNDYTDYQNTTVRQYYDLNGNAVSELKNTKGESVKADTSYAFNAEIQKTGDAKTAANNYLKWCAQRHPVYDGKNIVGYATFKPKFSSSPYGTDFTRHENYYKLLEDFNTYDSVTEKSAVQGAVTMNFPSEENRLNEQQMAEYKNAMRETGVFTEQDIEKYAKKADMTFKEIINAEVGNRANYAATQAPKWESTVKEVEAKLQKDYGRSEKQSSRDFTYKELIAKSDIKGRVIKANRTVKLTSNGSIDRAWVVSEVLRQCETIQTKSSTPTHFVNVPDIGKNVEVSGDGIRHGFIKFEAKNGKSVSPKSLVNARASLDLPQILQNSIEVNRSERGDNAEVEFSHILIGVTAMEDHNGNVEYYVVRSVVESRKNQGAILTEANVIGKLHAINAKKIGQPQAQVGGINTALASSSLFSYSVADLLNDVKSEFDDTFSNDVYKHFGMTRKANDFSKHLKFSDRDTDGTKFSMRESVEETKDLLAYHNITVKLLLDVLERNGLLMPSLAITNKGMTDFGEISLLFDKRTIDPFINALNKLYGADAWTPTQTQLKKNAKFDTNKTVNAVNTIKNSIGTKYVSDLFNITAKQFRDTIIKADGSIYDAYAHDIGMQTAYAMEKGIISKIPTAENGTVDKVALQAQLNSEMDTDNGWRQYKRWLNNISDTIITSYDKASNADILRNMKAQPASAKTFKLSENGELVVPAVEYASIDEVRKNKNRLSENADETVKAVASEFIALAKSIGDTKTVVNAINIAFANRYSVADIVRTFNRSGINMSTETARQLQALYKRAVELPTQYFEAKPHREIGLDEIKAVVMPDSADMADVKAKLEEIGISVVEYKAGSKESRVEALNSMENLKFSERTPDSISNRHLLANAFEGISRSSVEYGMIQDYKRNIDKLNKLENQLSDVNAEIRQLRFGKDIERDPERLKALEEKAAGLAKEINKYDKRLINMEASEPLRKVLDRERKKARQETIKRTKEIQQNRKLRKEQTELRKRIRRTIMDLDKILNKGDKKRNVKDSLQAFVNQSIKATDVLFMDDVKPYDMLRAGFTATLTESEKAQVEEARKMLDELDEIYGQSNEQNPAKDPAFVAAEARLDAKIAEMSDIFERENMAREETTVSGVISKIMLEYKKLEKSPQIEVRNAYSDAVYEHMGQLAEFIGNTRIKDMSTEQLQKLYEMYSWVKATVTMSNKFFAENIKKNVAEMASQSVNEFKTAEAKRKQNKRTEAVYAVLDKIGWSNEKVMYALRRMDNSVISTLMQNIINGEDVTMKDVQDAIKFRKEIEKKYNYKKWDLEKTYTFEDKHGEKFEMNLQQMLSFYAYSRRESARDHIAKGGIVVKTDSMLKKDSTDAHAITEEGIAQIESALTEEQRAYVRDMQGYLSDVMGAKGNEVSLKLYGIKMFNEETYFPIRSSSAYLAKAGEANLKAEMGITNMASAGFTKSLVPHAATPIELGNFLDVWANHVNEMSRYHGFVLPMEDFRRVFNFSSYATDDSSTAVRASMENAFGKDAVKYFDDLYRDLNSGASVDRSNEKIVRKWFSRFKKNAVMYSLSVVVQQPTAIVRAGALIDKRYFGIFGSTGRIATGLARLFTKNHTKLWNEMLEYAPGVTTIKEIGGFDTATGGSILSALKEETYENAAEHWNAFKKNPIEWTSKFADDNFLSRIPAYADQIAWVEIWNAVKRETLANNKGVVANTKEHLELSGKRFSEVIRMTQVYDSVFAKSPLMRSQSLAVQMVTSFMAEPNTTINMVEDGLREMTRGNKRSGARFLWTAAAAITFNNLIKSVVYAMRDDDEDQNFKEKYLESVIGGMLNDVNFLNYIPIARDVWSVAQGYDVERADMTLISDLADNLTRVSKLSRKDTSEMDEDQLAAHEKAQLAAYMALVDSIGALTGFPIKNIRRDVKAFVNTFFGDKVGESTKLSIAYTVEKALNEAAPTMLRPDATPKSDVLYEAIVAGDNVYLNRLKNSYKDEKAYTNAVRKALRENDERISEAAQALYENNAAEYKRIYQQIRSENKFSADDILSAIDSEAVAIQKDTEGGGESAPYSASDFVKAVIVGDSATAKTMRNEYISFKVSSGVSRDDAEKKFQDSVQNSVNDAYKENLLTASAAKKMLIDYAGKDESEAEDRVTYWEFKRKYPQYNLSDDAVWDYYDIAEPLGIGLREYVDFVEGKKSIETKRDANGKIIYSSRDQTVDLIDSLDLTDDQKDALYILEGYSKNKLWDTPWH